MASPERIIIVQHLEHATAALQEASALGCAVTLQSPPDAIFFAGGLYLLKMFEQAKEKFPNVKATCIIDCADTAAEAISAIQMGHKHLRSSAPHAVKEKIRDVAAQEGATLVDAPYIALDLINIQDTNKACREWLAKHG